MTVVSLKALVRLSLSLSATLPKAFETAAVIALITSSLRSSVFGSRPLSPLAPAAFSISTATAPLLRSIETIPLSSSSGLETTSSVTPFRAWSRPSTAIVPLFTSTLSVRLPISTPKSMSLRSEVAVPFSPRTSSTVVPTPSTAVSRPVEISPKRGLFKFNFASARTYFES